LLRVIDRDRKRLAESVVLGKKRFFGDKQVIIGGWEGFLLGLWYC
jgi:hypothetical protein